MDQASPYSGDIYVTKFLELILATKDEGGKGYFLDLDLEYTNGFKKHVSYPYFQNLKEFFTDFLKKNMPRKNKHVNRLNCDWIEKWKIYLYYRILKFWIVKVRKIRKKIKIGSLRRTNSRDHRLSWVQKKFREKNCISVRLNLFRKKFVVGKEKSRPLTSGTAEERVKLQSKIYCKININKMEHEVEERLLLCILLITGKFYIASQYTRVFTIYELSNIFYVQNILKENRINFG